MQEIVTDALLEERLDTHWLGRRHEVHAEIDSTNTRAVALARQGAPEGTLVLAEHQTAGRGRLGRRWFAPPGSALLFSLLFRPTLAPGQAQRVAMICSLAAVQAVEQICGLRAGVKWPNDILLNGKKLGGMLAELGPRGHELDYVVVGLGLNVNLDPEDLPEVAAPPTSLWAELGRRVSRLNLLVALLERAEHLYDQLRMGWCPHQMWRQHLATLGEQVRVRTAEEVIEGLAEDVDEDGALMVRLSDSSLRRILVGDVTLRAHRPS